MERRRAGQRGFTLTELMVVVAMVSVLALLAVYGVRKYVFASKAAEPIYMIGLIKTAQEAWREEFNVYFSPSSSIDSYYPNTSPKNVKSHWINESHADYPNGWKHLGVNTPNPVMFGYATVGGTAAQSPPSLGTKETFTFDPKGEPWFVVKAVGDQNDDGVKSIFVGSSFTQEIYAENEQE